MGQDKIRYFLFLEGRWRWRPTKTMRRAGFRIVAMGKGGPHLDPDGSPSASIEDKRRAILLKEEWDGYRTGRQPREQADRQQLVPGSVGEAWQRVIALRKAERAAKGVVWTKEQESRDDWPRAWKWLGPKFGDCDPATIQPEHFLSIDEKTGAISGLLVDIERAVSVTERHRVVKVWRAFWKKMAGMKHDSGKYCELEADPARSFRNSAPDARQASWQRREVLQRVQRAWRMGYHGLAACMATAWDSMCSPVDVRTLTPSKVRGDAAGIWFAI